MFYHDQAWKPPKTVPDLIYSELYGTYPDSYSKVFQWFSCCREKLILTRLGMETIEKSSRSELFGTSPDSYRKDFP